VPQISRYARFVSSTLLITSLFTLGCASGTPASSSNPSSAATTSLPAVAPGRAIWFWESTAQQAIIASSTAQDAAIANFKSWNVTQVYGSYSSQIDTAPASIRAWNAKLAANGIASYFLISTTNFFFPENWSSAQSWIQTYFLSFNAASKTGEGFVGLAFDVEPQSFTGSTTYPSWGTATPAQRRVYMTDMLDMLESSRALLTSNAYTSAPIETYLTYNASSLTSTIGWANADDRNAWYTALAQTVDRVSVEEYGISSTATILSQYQTNDALLNGKSRISLSSATGAEWTTESQFWSAVTTTEAQTSKFTDIEDYDTTTGP